MKFKQTSRRGGMTLQELMLLSGLSYRQVLEWARKGAIPVEPRGKRQRHIIPPRVAFHIRKAAEEAPDLPIPALLSILSRGWVLSWRPSSVVIHLPARDREQSA